MIIYDFGLVDIKSGIHVTDLVTVSNFGYDSENKWACLFAPNDKRKAYDNQVTERQLTTPSNRFVGHIHPRDKEDRRTRNKKRTKIQANGLMAAATRLSEFQKNREQQQLNLPQIRVILRRLISDIMPAKLNVSCSAAVDRFHCHQKGSLVIDRHMNLSSHFKKHLY